MALSERYAETPKVEPIDEWKTYDNVQIRRVIWRGRVKYQIRIVSDLTTVLIAGDKVETLFKTGEEA